MNSFSKGTLGVCLLAAAFGLKSRPENVEKYELDTADSFAIFSMKHSNTGNLYGRFNDIKGTLTFDRAKPENSAVEIEIQSASIDTNNSKRDQRLKSSEFLNSKEFPVLRFTSKSVKPSEKSEKIARPRDWAGEWGAYSELDVSGDLAIHGLTKPIEVPVACVGSVRDEKGKMHVGYEAKFKIKRKDFGMNLLFEEWGDDIDVILSIVAVGS